MPTSKGLPLLPHLLLLLLFVIGKHASITHISPGRLSNMGSSGQTPPPQKKNPGTFLLAGPVPFMCDPVVRLTCIYLFIYLFAPPESVLSARNANICFLLWRGQTGGTSKGRLSTSPCNLPRLRLRGGGGWVLFCDLAMPQHLPPTPHPRGY